MSWFMAEFDCPTHGRFESLLPRAEAAYTSSHGCPSCGVASARVLSAPKVGTVWGAAASHAKSNAPHENPAVLNTQPLADGMRYSDWKKKRREFRAEERRKEIKRELG